MTKVNKRILRQFQCDFNRSIEENFAQVLTENEQVRLFFINEDQAFTDGRNIVVDPAFGEIFADKNALERTEDFFRIGRHFSTDPWKALRVITRGQNIHESLHVLYSDFPNGIVSDSRASTKVRRKALARINNIIEDVFIEAVGCSEYDNLEFYLQFDRVASLFSVKPIEGTAQREFKKEITEARKPIPFVEFLNHMTGLLLYPMAKLPEPPPEIAEYVERTTQLFWDGSVCGESKERYGYTQKIFDIVEPIIPESEDNLDDELLDRLLPGVKTHSADNNTINSINSKGRTVEVSRRLFTELNGDSLPDNDISEQIKELVEDYNKDKDAALKIVLVQPVITKWNGTQFDCAVLHKGIEIIEEKPKPNLNLRRAYLNIYNKYRVNINSYNSRFAQLLKARIPVREEKKQFGSGINSQRLYDVKKRYWFRNADDIGVPDIAVLFLIDGSGSMGGPRRENAMVSCVILHEVLKKQGITHAIVEHRAIYNKPTVKHNILIDFNAKDEEKYNILALQADDGTREGLSLYWVERYLSKMTSEENKLVIVLSDGEPAHGGDGDYNYFPPVSKKDTANAATKIIRRGTDIIAVALDDGEYGSDWSCYDSLKEIYPSVISCTDLKRLTGQLLSIVSKNL